MFVLRRIYCRVFQLAFRAALPFLPYRNPEIISSDAEIPAVLRKHKLQKVMIVTDAGIRKLGLTSFLEKTLAEEGIGARKYFYPLTNTFDCFHGKYDPSLTPVALHISKRVLTLPLYADLALEDVDRICEIIIKCKR